MDLNGFDKPLFALGGNPAPRAGIPMSGKKRGRGGNLTSLISEGGAIGGAVAGATAGSVVPVVGTAIGGILGAGIGAFAGRVAENKVRDDRLGLGDAAKEGATAAVLQGPLKLLKYGKTAGTALKAGAGLESALMSGADDAAKFSLRSTVGGKVLEKGEKALGKQFKLTPSQLFNYQKKNGEDAVKVIQRYGITSADDVTAKGIQPLQDAFDEVITKIPPVSKKGLESGLKKAYEPLLKSAVIPEQQLGQQLKAQADEILKQQGDTIDSATVNDLRKRFDSFVSYTQRGTPDHNAVKMTADTLRKTLQNAADTAGVGYQGKTFKEIGRDLSKLYDLDEIVGKQAQLGRGSSPMGLLNLVGAGAGGAAGGPVGTALGYGATKAINSNLGRKVSSQGTQLLGNTLMNSGQKAVGGNQILRAGIRAGGAQAFEGMTAQPQPTQAQGLEDVFGEAQSLPNQTSQSYMPNTMTSAAAPSNVMDGLYQNSQQMSSGSPYAKENLLSDIQRDPQNADKYISYYQTLDDIFNPQAQQLELGNTAIQSISDLQTGLDNLGGLEQRIGTSSANAPLFGSIRSKNPFDTEAKSLRAEIDRVKQVVGKALEGGVLRKEDEEKYARILPTINDTDAVAAQKISAIRNDLQNKLNTYYTNQQQYSGSGSGLGNALTNAQQGGYL